MDDKAIVTIDTRSALANAKARYTLLVEFTKQVMIAGKDYGKIPGAGDKPTLFKPGAEKLNSLFELSPDFTALTATTDFEKGFFYFQYKCDLYDKTGRKTGSGIGSCNSREKKYRYRNIAENKATDDDKARAIRKETKNGQYGKYTVYIVENTDPADLVNTLDKMAQKRALVAATLIACNASEFFTQDIEDLAGFAPEDVLEGEFTETTGPGNPPPPTPTKTSKTKVSGDFNPIQALIDWGLAQDIPHAAGMLNKSPYPKGGMTPDELQKWGKLYRGWRDVGKEPDEAAEKATAGAQPG